MLAREQRYEPSGPGRAPRHAPVLVALLTRAGVRSTLWCAAFRTIVMLNPPEISTLQVGGMMQMDGTVKFGNSESGPDTSHYAF